MIRPTRILVSIALVAAFALTTAAVAQESAGEPAAPESTPLAVEVNPEALAEPTAAPASPRDPEIPLDELDLRLMPLSLDEMMVETAAWQELLRGTLDEMVDTELQLRRTAESEGGEAGLERLRERQVELRLEQTAIIDRLEVVLLDAEAKGGDMTAARQYLSTIARVESLNLSSARALLRAWLVSDSGGLLVGRRAMAFVVILFASWMLGRILGRIAHQAVVRAQGSQLLRATVRVWARWSTIIVGSVVGISALGVDIGPLLALLGAAGFAIGFALRDSLSNFASGALILFYRPFDVGDLVEVTGILGTVDSMTLASTNLRTLDNKVIVVPNNVVWQNALTNATASTKRRVDMVFGIGYGDDMDAAIHELRQIVDNHPKILREPEPDVQVHELGDSSVNIICRPWVHPDDYWAVHWDVTKKAKERFDAAGISIPFPQRDVHLFPAGGADDEPGA